MLWVKEPQRFPDVPRAQVIADCMAALSPSQPLWSKVTDEIDRLQERGEISEGDVAILRYSHDATQAIMDSTLGEPTRVTPVNIQKALARAKKHVQEPIVRERDAALERAAEADSASQALAVEHALRERRQEEEVEGLRRSLQQADERDLTTLLSVCRAAKSKQTRTDHAYCCLGAPGIRRRRQLAARNRPADAACRHMGRTDCWGTRATDRSLRNGARGCRPVEAWVHARLERRQLTQLELKVPSHAQPRAESAQP